jgi:solute carrier family 25 phosphate transporter 23/24/25/41
MPKEATMANIYSYFKETARLDQNGEISIPLSKNDSFATSVKYFVAGALAGAVSRTLTAPLDRLRVYLQINAGAGTTPKGGFALVEATKTIYTQNNRSILTFFRGNGLNVFKIAPESALKFATHEYMKDYLGKTRHSGEKKVDLTVYERLLAGGVAGVVSQGGVYPLEVLKTRVMTAGSSSDLKGMHLLTDTAKNMWREAGIRAYYRGLLTAVVGVFPFAAIDMSVFDALKQSWARDERKRLRVGEQATGDPGLMRVLGYGMFSGMVASCAVYPIGLVRTRLQAQGTPAHPQTYTGAMDVVQRTFRREGIRGFYKGLVPTLIKVIPAAGLSYATYDVCKKQMNLA